MLPSPLDKPLIYDLDLQGLNELLASWNQPAYRAQQIWNGLYQNFWNDPLEFSSIPISLRKGLASAFYFANLKPEATLASNDGETHKTLFKLRDGLGVETVLMGYKRRFTLCISTQAGCAMGCVFCATGQMGFKRNLTSGEIIEQVLYYARRLKVEDKRLSNIVYMGMGEPLHNYTATIQSIDRLGHHEGFNFGARRFTISSVGLVPGIKKFAAEKRQTNLAISLHATDDLLRSSLLPINNKYPIQELIGACKEYIRLTNRRITFEWALIKDVNDSTAQAYDLGKLLQNFRRDGAILCHVNVIPLNPTRGFSGDATTRQRALDFQHILKKQGIPCTIRLRRGIDIQAGCGQLAYEKQ